MNPPGSAKRILNSMAPLHGMVGQRQ
jgi:hypothetical protein